MIIRNKKHNLKAATVLVAACVQFSFSGCMKIQHETVAEMHVRKMHAEQYAEAERLAVPVKFKNSLGMELVLIPAGKFLMGSPAGSKDADFNEMPQHEVSISKPFYIGTCEITQEQYQRLMNELPSSDTQTEGSQGPDYPVEFVSQRQAGTFCRLLSEKEGCKYRLPTEAEWEYACRAGTDTPFYFGETISTDQANFDGRVPYANSPKGIYRGKTTPVASFPPNAFGLYDMHGNVWERCSDKYSKVYYIQSPVIDPEGPSKGSQGTVLRGGGCHSGPWYCRSAARDRFSSADRFDYHFGFRVVCELNINSKSTEK